MTNNLQSILGELKEILLKETIIIDSGNTFLLTRSARDKIRILSDLENYQSNDRNPNNNKASQIELTETRKLLKANLDKLQLRVNAIGEITKTIEDGIIESESDGTYDIKGFRGYAV